MSDVFRLDGKKAVVTGGSRGIGRGIALSLARQGADVLLVARDQAQMEQVEREVRALGRQARSARVDVRDAAAIDALMEKEVEAFGGIDIFISNAGVTSMTRLLDTPQDQVDRIIDTNLKGSIHFLQAAAGRMVKQGRGGAIVIITSINALWPLPSQAVYSSTKAALEALMHCMASDLAKHGIRVNSVAPGAIRTDMNAHFTPEVEARVEKMIALRRIGTAEEIGDVVAFLASEAARYVTETTLVADGGYLLRQ